MDNPIDIYSNIQKLVKNDIEKAINDYSDKSKYGVFPVVAHKHTGVDSQKIDHRDINSKMLYLPITIPGLQAATATNYGVIFIAPFPCSLLSVYESHQTLGTDAGAVTLNLEKLTGNQALDAGSLMISNIDLKGAINALVTGTLVVDQSILNLKTGDRIALKDSGTLTSVAGVSLIITLTY